MERIEQARTGREGLEKALRTKPDLIISDVRMPHMDGLAMATALTEQKCKDALHFYERVFRAGLLPQGH